MGEAVGFLRECRSDLRAIQHSSLSKPQLRKSGVAARALKEEESVCELLQRYTLINDTVSYQTIPSRQDLQRIIPNGRGVLQMKKFQLPLPKFGPYREEETNASYARSGAYY
ncbi:hypothetical protein BX666DRAFT_1848073 [Dichotomocladium elegans]|nr:hypothetical protein BX666DRAFT_1848073 [Dichotomocladium elegans]